MPIMPHPDLKALILRLFDVEAVKFGEFTLKSGINSPIYFDLRVIVSYPELLSAVATLVGETIGAKGIRCDKTCGVPYAALPIASCVSVQKNLPMLMLRKEAKDYGTKKLIEGHFSAGETCLVIEDVVTSGTSILETAQILRKTGLTVTDAIVVLDREQRGSENLKQNGVTLHSICSIGELLRVLEDENKIGAYKVAKVKKFLAENSSVVAASAAAASPSTVPQTFGERASCAHNPVARKLFNIMEKKQTNLAIAVDVTTSQQLLKMADELGPYMCVLKTHVDILTDFTPEVTFELHRLAKRHEFLVMEDRKFSDIGHTVELQYGSGVYHICEWADIVTVHPLPGPDIVTALTKVASNKERACLFVAEMSSRGNLTNKEYASAAVKMAADHPVYVMGFVSQSRLVSDPACVHMMPGVNLEASGDSLGQQYSSPSEAVAARGADVIIVGRGIVGAENPVAAAKAYRQAAMDAYHTLVKKENNN